MVETISFSWRFDLLTLFNVRAKPPGTPRIDFQHVFTCGHCERIINSTIVNSNTISAFV